MNSDFTGNRGIGLSAKGLRKSYARQEVLRGVDLDVLPGEILVIMGPSGSGKSVLLRQLIGLEEPDEGEILIEGQQLLSAEATAHYRLAMVFQSSALLSSLTVGENVGIYLTEHRLKSPDEITEIVSKTLESVGLKGAENKMPGELSGGMQKCAAIARALVTEPQLIFYDEPTSELDPPSSVNIAKNIMQLNEQIHVTTVIVSHDRGLAFGIADHIAMFDGGRVITQGTPAEIKHCSNALVQRFLNAKIDRNLIGCP